MHEEERDTSRGVMVPELCNPNFGAKIDDIFAEPKSQRQVKLSLLSRFQASPVSHLPLDNFL